MNKRKGLLSDITCYNAKQGKMCHCFAVGMLGSTSPNCLRGLVLVFHIFFVRSHDHFRTHDDDDDWKTLICGRNTLHNAELQSATRVPITKIDVGMQWTVICSTMFARQGMVTLPGKHSLHKQWTLDWEISEACMCFRNGHRIGLI